MGNKAGKLKPIVENWLNENEHIFTGNIAVFSRSSITRLLNTAIYPSIVQLENRIEELEKELNGFHMPTGYNDYEGNPLSSGDTIRHPDGTLGKIYLDKSVRESIQWRVMYGDKTSLYLGNQVNDQGRAVRVQFFADEILKGVTTFKGANPQNIPKNYKD